MRRFLVYSVIIIGILSALVALVTFAAVEFGNVVDSRIIHYSFVAFMLLIMVVAGGVITFGMFKLTIMAFFKNEDPGEDNVLDEEGPIDRYLK